MLLITNIFHQTSWKEDHNMEEITGFLRWLSLILTLASFLPFHFYTLQNNTTLFTCITGHHLIYWPLSHHKLLHSHAFQDVILYIAFITMSEPHSFPCTAVHHFTYSLPPPHHSLANSFCCSTRSTPHDNSTPTPTPVYLPCSTHAGRTTPTGSSSSTAPPGKPQPSPLGQNSRAEQTHTSSGALTALFLLQASKTFPNHQLHACLVPPSQAAKPTLPSALLSSSLPPLRLPPRTSNQAALSGM